MRIRLAVVAFTALAAGLRFSTLDLQSYWGDETITARLLDGNLGETISNVRAYEITPPLYDVLAWGWSQLFGLGEVGLRSFSALAGTATVPLVYGAGAELVSRRAGLVAAALAAVNPLLVWYSQEARAYALLACLGAASFLFFARALRERSRRALALWAIVSALALATHYFALFLVAVEAVCLLAAVSRRAAAAGVAAAVLFGAALLPVALPHVETANRVAAYNERGPSLSFRIEGAGKKFMIGEPGIGPIGHHARIAVLVVLIGLALVAIRGERRERRGAWIALGVAAVAAAVPVAIALGGFDVVNTRNLIALWIPVTVAYSAGFGARRAGVVGLGLAAVLFALFLTTTVTHMADERAHRDDWRGLARSLGPTTEPRVFVLVPLGTEFAVKVYRPEARDLGLAGRMVREVDVVTWPGGVSAEPALGPVAAKETRRFGRLTLVRYRLRTPRRMTRAIARSIPDSALLVEDP